MSLPIEGEIQDNLSETLNNIKLSISLTKIIVCNGITQYPTKEQRSQLIEEAHSLALGGHKGVTKTNNRIRQKFFWENMKFDFQKYI